MSGVIKDGLLYTKDHEWVEVNDDTATVGITDHAQEALGDLVFVELPDAGGTVSAGSSFAVVESVKAASEVYAPVTGEVLEANEDLADSPESLNSDPYGCWIAKIKLANSDELNGMMSAEEYGAFLQDQ